jgi:hypothetical protein
MQQFDGAVLQDAGNQSSRMKSTKGGARKGAGSKAKDGATKMIRKNVSLDEPTIVKAQKIGEGELSMGLRVAVKDFQIKVKK